MEIHKERFYPVAWVADRLGCSVDMVYDLLAGRRLKAIKLGTSRGYRVTSSSLEAFIREAAQEFDAEF